MFWGNLSQEQTQQLCDLALQLQDIQPDYLNNENLLSGLTLTWFQCFAIEHCIISRGSIVSLDTGLGKTMTAMAYMKKCLMNSINKKGIFFCLPESVNQISSDFIEYADLNILTITGESSCINQLYYTAFNSYDILIVSYEALYSIPFANWLTERMSEIKVCVFDEAHEISQESIVHSISSVICKLVDNRMLLTATPITVSPAQIIRLLMMLDEDFIPDGEGFLKPFEIRNKDFELIDYKDIPNFSTEIYPRYVSWTRKELGLCGNYHPYLVEIEPTEEQRNCKLKDAYKIIKGNPESKQAYTLYALVKSLTKDNKKGLCYVYNRDISEQLCNKLRSFGIRAFVVNGDANNKRIRDEVLELFRNNDIDIILTNLTMSLNLACDYLIFWQYTNRAVQMLGRCERGFLVKDLDIYLLLTKDTVEVEQYQKNVYRRCKWLGQALAKNVDVFKDFSVALEDGDLGVN